MSSDSGSGPQPQLSSARPFPTSDSQRWARIVLAGIVVLLASFAAILLLYRPKRPATARPQSVQKKPVVLIETTAAVVRPREVLATVLGRAGLNPGHANRIAVALDAAGFNSRLIQPGDSVLVIHEDSVPCRLLYRRNYESVYQVDVESIDCRVSMLVRRLRREPSLVAGTIQNSLYEALTALGERPELVFDYADIFGWEIDFFTECQPGDSFLIVVERKYADTTFVGYGPILAARYTGQVGTFNAWHFTDGDNRTDYYNDEGQSLRKTFLKSPLRFSRVSSFFGRRRHPILRRVRMHHGVDYVAPKGTPVDCVADGRVIAAGWSGGYGRLVAVAHANGYETRYGHLSAFARGIRVGTTVTQGQTIGYVGSSGLSTGPHLHYEIRKNGRPTNPLRLDPPRAAPVNPSYEQQFFAHRDSLRQLIVTLSAQPQPPPTPALP